jgi:hypothetical protein
MLPAAKRHLRFANVMSVIAVFLALGGSAYALNLGRNSVGPLQLKRNAVSSPKVENHSLRGVDIKQSTLRKVKAANVYHLGMNANCSAAHPFPAGVSTDHLGNGVCEVAFPRNVRKCDATAQVDIRGVGGLIILDNPTTRIVRFNGEGPKKFEIESFHGGGGLGDLPVDLILVC